MTEKKERARVLILSHIASFSLMRRIGDHVYGGLSEMAFRGSEKDVMPGDLVAIQAALPSKWYLGWLVGKEWPEGHACEHYLIESIEDGEVCDWSNVGLIYYHRETVSAHPEWRWTDEQHDFKDRWWRACYKDRDAYMCLPIFPVFQDSAVELGVRVRHCFSKTVIRRSFPDWKKLSKKSMLGFYDEAKAELEAERPKAVATT